MADVYQRLLTRGGVLAPGQWTATDPSVVTAKALVCCKRCGGIDVLADDFAIEPDGRVTPRWHCSTVTCGETTWLQLEAFEP